MTPRDDAIFPICGDACEVWQENEWCPHVRDMLLRNRDASSIFPMSRICVPVSPVNKVWAEVSIGEEIAPGMADFSLVKSQPFTNDEEFVSLGMWTQGEGRSSMSSVIQEWAASFPVDTHCKVTFHGTVQQSLVDTLVFGSYQWAANQWHLNVDNACSYCYAKIQAVAARTSGGPHGLDGMVQGSSTNPRTVNQIRANQISMQTSNMQTTDPVMESLQNKYKSNRTSGMVQDKRYRQ